MSDKHIKDDDVIETELSDIKKEPLRELPAFLIFFLFIFDLLNLSILIANQIIVKLNR